MTNREAIIILKNLKKCYSMDYFDIEDNAALDIAILALEELEVEINILDEINKVKREHSIHIYEILDIIKKYIKEDAE